jgi:hypothetical protein
MSNSELTFVRDLDGVFDTRFQHARAARLGTDSRIARGVYVSAADLRAAGARESYIFRIRAIAGTRRSRPVLSHWSAAAIHGLPNLDPWPSEVHTIAARSQGSSSRSGVIRHVLRLADEDVTEVDGLLVTTIERTALDIAAIATPEAAVALIDRALLRDEFDRTPPMTTRASLQAAFERSRPLRAFRRVEFAISFASAQSGSPLESSSRVCMYRVGCPRPLLQVKYFDERGFIARVDFDWLEFGLVGEADGDKKYLQLASLSGKSIEQVYLDEKIGEDRLRALPKRVARWRWSVGRNPLLLRERLVRAGIPESAFGKTVRL